MNERSGQLLTLIALNVSLRSPNDRRPDDRTRIAACQQAESDEKRDEVRAGEHRLGEGRKGGAKSDEGEERNELSSSVLYIDVRLLERCTRSFPLSPCFIRRNADETRDQGEEESLEGNKGNSQDVSFVDRLH